MNPFKLQRIISYMWIASEPMVGIRIGRGVSRGFRNKDCQKKKKKTWFTKFHSMLSLPAWNFTSMLHMQQIYI